MDVTDKNFRDWENHFFGFGYGTGEEHILGALKKFFSVFSDVNKIAQYNYEKMEIEMTPIVAWLMINIFCRIDIIEYGTSPRFGWLTEKGKALYLYVKNKTIQELCDIVLADTENSHCYPDCCNCEGEKCDNPLW